MTLKPCYDKYIIYSTIDTNAPVEIRKIQSKFRKTFDLVPTPHPLSLSLSFSGNSDVDNDVAGCRLIRAMANRGKCHVTRNNQQLGSKNLFLFIPFPSRPQYFFDTFAA